MSRIPLPTDEELSPESKEFLSKLPPLNVIRMFANAPDALKPLSELGGAILLKGELDARLREIAILAVGHATGSAYEATQHENICRAIGMEEAEIRAAADGNPDELDDEAQLVWKFGYEIARNVQAPEDMTTAVLERFGRRQATELVVACAFYSAVARIIETCGVEFEDVLPTENINPDDWVEKDG